jgi:hypothetical protein
MQGDIGSARTATRTRGTPTPSQTLTLTLALSLILTLALTLSLTRFPDEVDTPMDAPGGARARFARFRGLRSFRTSQWHPQESHPM